MASQETKDELSLYSLPSKRSRLWMLIGQSRDRIESIAKLLETKPNYNVWLLDAGSGHGTWADLFSGKGYNVVGVDLSNVRMRLANERSTNETVYLACDLLNTPFKYKAFSICFCSYVLHHFRKMEHLLAELSRITQRGGELLLTEPNGSNLIYRLTEFGKKFAPRKWMLAKGIDSTNETIHSSISYIDSLTAQGFTNMEIMFVNSRQLECRFDGKTITSFLDKYGVPIGSLMLIRMLLFKAASRISSSNLSCDQIIIHARKQEI